MDSRTNDEYTELPSVETPEDVAVLYSWANLHGAKYRDFSASRREYRAQLRHRAAEQARDLGLQAQADAERAAEWADQQAHQADQAHLGNGAQESRTPDPAPHQDQAANPDNLLSIDSAAEAAAAAEWAAAEHLEALRRAEAARHAEAVARNAQRELAEAHASARRNTASQTDPEPRRRASEPQLRREELPGEISDPYTPTPYIPEGRPAIQEPEPLSGDAMELRPQRLRPDLNPPDRNLPDRPGPTPLPIAPTAYTAPVYNSPERVPSLPPATPALVPELPTQAFASAGLRRPQGYRPDDASGVRQIYRGPDPPPGPSPAPTAAPRQIISPAPQRQPASPAAQAPLSGRPVSLRSPAPVEQSDSLTPPSDRRDLATPGRTWTAAPSNSPLSFAAFETPEAGLAGNPEDPIPRRRRQDQPGFRMTDSDRAIAAYRREEASSPDYPRPNALRAPQPPRPEPPPARAETAVPEWLHGQQATHPAPPQLAPAVPPSAGSPAPASAADTLQRSRERVASRWYALKGVFEQPGQDRNEPAPVRQKETRPPVLAVFSFAGGVGKTSLVATLGRSLSSLGEKVLLTDTTSHGLLPFYFGASELREGTVRTFSPPSGSTDAPIYLVNYAVDQSAGDEAAQENVVEEITKGGRGSHRILLDLTSSTGWLIRRMAHLNPTVLVPLAPDMNSVISLQSIERFLHGITSPEGAPVQVFYLLNQFDASLPLHLDVREVLRRQLGERLLPFIIRRAPAVSEALAEGMTIVDYAADTPVAEDYMNVASWLRTIAAPATAGFRNVRWSER